MNRNKQVMMMGRTGSSYSTTSTGSFPLKKYPSMDLPYDEPDPSLVTPKTLKKMMSSSLIEFPTSPHLIFGEEIIHFNHPKHPLSRIVIADLYACSGCKEYGSGKRFACQLCDFQLHDFCALAPSCLKAHPLHMQHQLFFYTKPVKGGIVKSKCEICGKATNGYNYSCKACSYQMHPCCAMLSNEIIISIHPHPLKLLPPFAASNNGAGNASSSDFACRECRRKRSGRIYSCTICNYYLHAVCAKDMINGLQANGIKGPQKPSILSTAAKLVSQVLIDFIEGLVEGLGESVAQTFISSVAKGHHVTTT